MLLLVFDVIVIYGLHRCVEVVDWNETNALATFWRKDQEGEVLPYLSSIRTSLI